MSEKYEVSYRGGFADRYNLHPVNSIMQSEDFDKRTRIVIRNTTLEIIDHILKIEDNDYQDKFCRALVSNVYSMPLDYNARYYFQNLIMIIDETFYHAPYYDILSLLEFIISYFVKNKNSFGIVQIFNAIFAREYVGYRYIDAGFVPITDNVEVHEIEKALLLPYEKVKVHIGKALKLLSDRSHPDYENSIKESITAVETVCEIIMGSNSTLGDMLKKLEKSGVKIHPALKEAFSKLYGFTSDASGIRHAGQLDMPSATFEEAQYMVVSCSAFVNYLIGVKAKIE